MDLRENEEEIPLSVAMRGRDKRRSEEFPLIATNEGWRRSQE